MKSSAMRRGLAALAAAALMGVGVGCGGEKGARGELEWVEEPRLYSPEHDERVVAGEVRNDSLRPIEIAADEIRVVDASGRAVDGYGIFLQTFAHGLYGDVREPPNLPDSELERVGRLASLEPGETSTLTVSWRVPREGAAPERIEYPSGSLPIP